MAKINPVKVKQEADKLEKAGRIQDAIGLYRQVTDDNPRDWNVINKVGDLFAKLNRFKEAAEQYAKVADFYAKDGFHLKAIAIWKKINKLDASALEPYVNLAELYGKQGLMMEAKSQYQYVVDEYIKRGKMRDAGEILRKMAEIDPGDLKIRSKLADLYIREGNAPKAVEEHIAIAEELNKKGHLAEALQVLEKGLKIDPRSSRLRVELARVHLVQKNFDKAARYLEEAVQQSPSDTEVLARLGDAYLGSKKIEEAEAIFKRLLELDPGDEEARVQMGRVFLMQRQPDRAFEELAPLVDKLVQRKDGERAAVLLQQVVQANPSHVPSLNKLVEIYQQLGKDSATLATYSQLTEAYVQQGQLAEAASALEILVAREPQNQQHRTKLDFVRGKLGAGGAAPAPPRRAEPGVELVDEEFDLSAAEEAPALDFSSPGARPAARPQPPPAAAVPAPSRPAIEVTGPLSEEDKEFIEEHLAEGKVFRKYGLVDKAADQFEAVVARFPDNVEARQELREIFKDKGLSAKAAEQSLALAEIFRLRGDEAAAAAQEDEAERVLPGSSPRARVAVAPAPPPSARPPAAEAAIALGGEEEVPFAESEEEIPLDVEEAAPSFEPAAPEFEEETFDLGAEMGAETELPSQFIEDEPAAPAAPPPAAVAAPVPARAPARPPVPPPVPPPAAEPEPELDLGLGGEETLAEETSFGFEEFPLDEPVAEAPVPPAVAPRAPAPPPAAVRVPEPPPARPPAAQPKAPFPFTPPPSAQRPPLPRPSPPPPPKPAPLTAKPAPAPAAASGLPAELARVLEEIDSYVSLGFVDDAKEMLREAGVRFPGHPALADKIAELGLEEAAPEAPSAPVEAASAEFDLGEPVAPDAPAESRLEDIFGDLDVEIPSAPPLPGPMSAEDLLSDTVPEAPPIEPPAFEPLPLELEPSAASPEDLLGAVGAPASEGEGIDLGAELGELFGAQSAVEEGLAFEPSTELGDAGLADIFKEFKKGVDKQLGKEDYDTRYNLGIAYKEMGLIDEAIAEFQLAAKDENRLLECSSMLGICFMDKGMPKLAIKWFEKGLKVPDRNDEEYAGLRYDLAMAFEAAGDLDRALSLFSDLYGQDANFRDVATKVRELRATQG